MSIRWSTLSTWSVPFRRLSSLVAFGSFTTLACGGYAIPIGGDADSDDTDTATSDTTTRDTTMPADTDDANTSADVSDDRNDTTTGGGNTGDTGGGPTPSGVSCQSYAACDVNTPCQTGDCLSFDECSTAICIPTDEACKLSCPVADDCAVLQSYPGRIACDDKVPAIPGAPAGHDQCTVAGGRCLPLGETAPPTYTISDLECSDASQACWVLVSPEPSNPTGGVSCENYEACDGATTCAAGQACIAFPEIGTALCITTEEACNVSCPDPTSCLILESDPSLLSCPGRVDASCSASGGTGGDAGAPAGVECEQHETCDASGPCDEGSCIKVPGCEVPLCIDAALACEQSCGNAECGIDESYPEQLFCSDDEPTEPGEDPDQPVSSDAAASAPGSPGPGESDAGAEQ